MKEEIITNFELVEIFENEPRVSHKIIAEQTKNKEKSILDLITRYKLDFEQMGDLKFNDLKSLNSKGGRPSKVYFLNELQATLLMTYLKNNEIVRNFKIRLVKEFFKMREILKSKNSQPFQNPKSDFLQKIEERTKIIEQAGKQFEVFEKVFHKIGITEKTELAITSNRAVKNETTIDFIALSGKNGLEVEEKFFTVTELCEFIRESDDFSEEVKLLVSTKDNSKLQPRNLNKILEQNNFQVRDLDSKQWKPIKQGENFSKFVQNKSLNSTKNIFHLNWKIEVLREVF